MTSRCGNRLVAALLVGVARLGASCTASASPAVTCSVTDLGVDDTRSARDSIDRDTGLIREADGSQAYASASGASGWSSMTGGTSITAARRGEDGTWRNVQTIAQAASPPDFYGNSIVGDERPGHVLATANDGHDAWTRSYYTRSAPPSINLYDSESGTLTRLADLLPWGN